MRAEEKIYLDWLQSQIDELVWRAMQGHITSLYGGSAETLKIYVETKRLVLERINIRLGVRVNTKLISR